ncbi:MAG: DUF3726 domain-containing protein [Rhizobiales bacterium]|nr:DUF3726 domain-containing protein [Hyphomicrobiales bacterium]
MRRSLNEIAGVLTKAAGGAGLALGLAEDVARAGVWLTRSGLDGVGAAARAIGEVQGPGRFTDHCRMVAFRGARAAHDGPSAVDLLLAGSRAESVVLAPIDEPLLVLGLAGVAAEESGVALAVEMAGLGRIVVGPAGPAKGEALARLLDGEEAGRASLTLSRHHGPMSEAIAGMAVRGGGAEVAEAVWARLALLAARTLVPADENSRQRGAGAGDIDND